MFGAVVLTIFIRAIPKDATMKMPLRWLASPSTSCLHAAEAMSRGATLVDESLATAIAEPARQWYEELQAAGIIPQRLWRHLIPLSATIENNQQLIELALNKAVGRSAQTAAVVPRLVSILVELESAIQSAVPDLAEQLPLRAKPLRQQWEARGPGLLQNVIRLTDQRLIVPSADVVLVHPVLGGGGAAHLLYNSVRIEAVLANPIERLPEVVRLGWLLAQLNVDLPMFSEEILADRVPRIAGLALLPVILTAAETVELARFDPPTLQLALTHWLDYEAQDDELSQTILDWWDVYQASRPGWHVALGALDKMLAATET